MRTSSECIIVRNPNSTRPYQHVLEAVYAYLMIASLQYRDPKYASWYNVGPDDRDCLRTGELVNLFLKHWGGNIKRIDQSDGGPHEANFLKLDCSRIKNIFGWHPLWDLDTAVKKVVEWSKAWQAGENVRLVMDRQIEEYVDQHTKQL